MIVVLNVVLVMGTAIGNQSGLSTTYKLKEIEAKAVNREVNKWEKGEVRQRL